MGYIVSFCTAGYRCGRTGTKIMKLLKTGKEKVFCKLNAVLTYKEYLEDFASEETRKAGRTYSCHRKEFSLAKGWAWSSSAETCPTKRWKK